ncbi:MAG: glycogen-binding domain-containing protein [Gemmatimonadaceae bacterium]|nr:glycogen-binding domain-containing protein [Gemmatimonadaceae bacterium]
MSIPPSSHQHTIVAAVLAAGLLAAPSARAQALSSSFDVGIASGSALAGPSPSALLLQPAIRWDHPRTSVSAQASWLASPAAHMDGDASVTGRYYSPDFHGLRFDLGAAAQRTAGPDVTASSNALLGDANVSYAFGASGVWLSGGERVSASNALPKQVQTFGAGTWRRVGSAVITASFTTSGYGSNGVNSLGQNPGLPGSGTGDTIPRSENPVTARQYADLESTVYWSHGALALDGLLGTRITTSYGQRSTWGRAQASWALGEQFALVAAGGTRAPEPSIGRMGGNFFSLGVRLASARWIAHALHPGARSSASSFGVRADGPTRIIYVHAPAARTVELMADFTDWQPVEMRHAANDEWELAMHIDPGSHRVNIRVDGGEWSAPPGAGTVQDEFNGVVGLVVVP